MELIESGGSGGDVNLCKGVEIVERDGVRMVKVNSKPPEVTPDDLDKLPVEKFIQIVSAVSMTSSRLEEIEKWIGEQVFRQKSEPKYLEVIADLEAENEMLTARLSKLRDTLLMMSNDDQRIASGWRTAISAAIKESDAMKKQRKAS